MNYYEWPGAPNCRRVSIYLREKDLEIPTVAVDLPGGEHLGPDFRKKNPAARVPVLELDDGSCICESLAIVEYLEELHPRPAMIGDTPEERARIRTFERRAEIGFMLMAGIIAQNSLPFFAERFDQSPDTVKYGRQNFDDACGLMDRSMADGPFVAGETPTIADCTLAAAVEFAERVGVELDPGCENLGRWWRSFSQRPSVTSR